MSLETLSPEEDSGHESCQSIRQPSDDRERMLHLETAVAWIKQQVDALRNYDREILQDLWKVRSNIQDIRELQRQVMKEESRFLDDSMASSEDGTLHRSITPTTKPPPNGGTWHSSSSASDLLPPPAHLLEPVRLEAAKGSTPVIVKKLMNLSNGGEAPTVAPPTGSSGDLPREKRVEPAKGEEKQAGGVQVVGAPVGTTDVISDMQKLRLRLEEECRQEIAAMDRQFQTRMHHHVHESNSRPGSAPSERERKELQATRPSTNPAHSRGSSDASDQSGPIEVHHRRDHSLPVTLEGRDGVQASPQRVNHTPPQPTRQMPSPHRSPGLVLSVERTVAASNNNNNKGFSTPPPVRSPPAYPQPVFQSFRQGNHAPRPPANVQFARTSSANSADGQQGGLTQSYDPSDVPVQVGGTHYSTLVVKGRKRSLIPSVDAGAEPQQQQYGSAPTESPCYDRLGPHLMDQPEHKAVPPLGNAQPSQQQSQPQLKLASQPARNSSTLQGPQRSHSKLEPRNTVPMMQASPGSAPLNGGGGAAVQPETIQPYMSTHEVKGEMKKYVPFADKKKNGIPEQTWC